jgi:hypothetical protein
MRCCSHGRRPLAGSRPAAVAGLLAATLACSLATAARAQQTDQGSSGGAVGPSLGQSLGEPLVPGMSGSLLQSGPAQAGGLGSSVSLPLVPGTTMRERIGAALGLQAPSTVSQPAVQFTPALSVQQGWTSNALNIPGRADDSAFTTIVTPSFALSADTARVQGNLTYAPSLFLYEPSRGQNQVAQNLSGHAHTILLPETLFLDVSAFAAQQTITGGFGPNGTVVQNRSNTAQDYSFSLSPYLQHRFGDIGTAEIGGAVMQTAQLVPGGTVIAVQPGLPPTAVPGQNATAIEEHVAFTSGEAFGRWLSSAYVSATQDSGTGVFAGAWRNTAAYEAGYAVSRRLTLLGTIGWDDLHYGGVPPVRIDTALWNVGVQLTPNPDSQIIVRYGRKDGIDAPFLAAVYVPSPRTRITANYSVTLSTDQEQLRSDLVNASTDPLGNPVDASTGQPLLAGNNFLGLLTSVYRLQVASLVGTLLLNRDTFQIGVNHQHESALNVAPGSGGAGLLSLQGTYGSLSWQHDVSEVVKAGLYLQYGVSQSESGAFSQSGTVLIGSAQVSYALSPTLSTSLQYSHTQSSFRSPLPGYSVDYVLAGVRKTF